MNYIIRRREEKILSYWMEGDTPVQIRSDVLTREDVPGLLYLARITRILPGLGAAFLLYGKEKKGFLPLNGLFLDARIRYSRADTLLEGDLLLVQMKKAAVDNKLPQFTTSISLSGPHFVLEPFKTGAGVSAKIQEPERSQLKRFAKELFDELKMGIILRTSAGQERRETLREEAHLLKKNWDELVLKAKHASGPCLLNPEESGWQRRLLDLPCREVEQILMDDPSLYLQAVSFLEQKMPSLLCVLRLYPQGQISMEKLYALEKHYEEATRTRVWLRSGAFLLIERTSTLTSIDVNTGKNAGMGRDSEEQKRLKTNLEAAREAARQMRLRNLSGMILIDFINMDAEEDKQAVLKQLQDSLSQDPVPSSVLDYTRLGLVEVTRKRTENPLD